MASVLLCLVIVVHKWQNWTCFQRATKGTLVDRLASGYKECFWLLNEVAQMKGRSLFQWKTALKYHTSKKTMLDCHKSNPWNPHCIKAFGKCWPSSVLLIIVQLCTHVHIDVFSGNFLVMVMKLVLSACGLILQMTDLIGELNSYWFFNSQWQYLEKKAWQLICQYITFQW